jgi:hypothetical protein
MAQMAMPTAAKDADPLPTIGASSVGGRGVQSHHHGHCGREGVHVRQPNAQRCTRLVARMEADAFTIWSQANQDMRSEYKQDGSFAPDIEPEVVSLNVHEGISVAPDLLANLKTKVAWYTLGIVVQHASRSKRQSAEAIMESLQSKCVAASVVLSLQWFAVGRPAMWMAKLTPYMLSCYVLRACDLVSSRWHAFSLAVAQPGAVICRPLHFVQVELS